MEQEKLSTDGTLLGTLISIARSDGIECNVVEFFAIMMDDA